MLDEVATLKSEDAKRREESNELLKFALNEIALHKTSSSRMLGQDVHPTDSTVFRGDVVSVNWIRNSIFTRNYRPLNSFIFIPGGKQAKGKN